MGYTLLQHCFLLSVAKCPTMFSQSILNGLFSQCAIFVNAIIPKICTADVMFSIAERARM